MELLLPACLDSIVNSPALPLLDVVVVNDGSRDSSLSIANSYSIRFPDSVRVIDKTNGNYGSTINAALPTLKGEYVKILDADDSFDTASLVSYIDYLEQVSGADMVVGPYIEITRHGEHKVGYNLYSKRIYGYGKPYLAEQVLSEGSIAFFAMHSIAYRTALLQQIEYRQSEGISYTDQQWCFFPIFNIQNIAFTDIALYRYNLAREGQTMDSAVQIRSINQLFEVVCTLAQHLDNYGKELSVARYDFLSDVVMRRMRSLLRKYLLDMDDKHFAMSNFDRVVTTLKTLAPAPLKATINPLLSIDLLALWERYNRRLPRWVRSVLIATDSAMQRIYRLLFS